MPNTPLLPAECALEDETYEDGAETQVECNRCVCACGNWVCTAMTCTGRSPALGGNLPGRQGKSQLSPSLFVTPLQTKRRRRTRQQTAVPS